MELKVLKLFISIYLLKAGNLFIKNRNKARGTEIIIRKRNAGEITNDELVELGKRNNYQETKGRELTRNIFG